MHFAVENRNDDWAGPEDEPIDEEKFTQDDKVDAPEEENDKKKIDSIAAM